MDKEENRKYYVMPCNQAPTSVCGPFLIHRIPWHEILDVTRRFCAIYSFLCFLFFFFPSWHCVGKIPSSPHGLTILVEGLCLKAHTILTREGLQRRKKHLVLGLSSTCCPGGLAYNNTKGWKLLCCVKRPDQLTWRPRTGTHHAVLPRRLTFRGNTSLFIEKKEAMALVQEQRPATFPHTRFAVSML